MTAENQIGIFDSGVGGLSVLREIRRELPVEDLLYVADSAYAPYENQSDEVIEKRAIAIAQLLVSESAKAIVVACNTATGILTKGADTLVLGCTHYPFLIPVIRTIVGPSVTIIDPSAAVARELRRRLQMSELLSRGVQPGSERFWTSGSLAKVQSVVARLWTNDVDVQRVLSAF
jgi:glutamate racemase